MTGALTRFLNGETRTDRRLFWSLFGCLCIVWARLFIYLLYG